MSLIPTVRHTQGFLLAVQLEVMFGGGFATTTNTTVATITGTSGTVTDYPLYEWLTVPTRTEWSTVIPIQAVATSTLTETAETNGLYFGHGFATATTHTKLSGTVYPLPTTGYQIDRCKAFDPGFPKPVKSEQYDLGSGFVPAAIIYENTPPGTGSAEFYFQGVRWLDIALFSSIPTQLGGIPTSFCMHFYDSVAHREVYGCYVTEYEISMSKGAPVMQKVSWKSTKCRTASEVGAAAPPDFLTTAPAYTKNCTVTITAGGVTLTPTLNTITKLTFKLTNEYSEDTQPISKEHLEYTYLTGRDISLSFDCQVPEESLFTQRMATTAPTAYQVVLTIASRDGTIATITLAGLSMVECNQGVMESPGLINYHYEFKKNTTFAITKA